MKYLEETDRNNLFKEANFIKTLTFPFLIPRPYHYVFLHPFLFHTRNIPNNNRRQSLTLFNILLSHNTMPNIQNGISMMPTCSLLNEAFYLVFININSIILISLDD